MVSNSVAVYGIIGVKAILVIGWDFVVNKLFLAAYKGNLRESHSIKYEICDLLKCLVKIHVFYLVEEVPMVMV